MFPRGRRRHIQVLRRFDVRFYEILSFYGNLKAVAALGGDKVDQLLRNLAEAQEDDCSLAMRLMTDT